MKNIILVFITIIFSISGCIMQEPDKFDDIKHPEPCFQNGLSFDKCENYSAPIPSDYMAAIFPSGIPLSLNFPNSYPLNIRLSSPVDLSTIEDGLFVLKITDAGYEVVPNNKYQVVLGELNTSTFQFSEDKTFLNIFPLNEDETFGTWAEGATYLVVMTKELLDINGLAYAKPAAFFMASSTFEITPDIVKALDPTMDDATAIATVQILLGMRAALNEPYQLIEYLLNKTKFDVSFLWSFSFNNQTVCFQSTDIANCENNPLPLPSDFMSLALPENTNLNISQKDKFSINFSSEVDLHTFVDNLVVVKKSLTTESLPEIVDEQTLLIKLDPNDNKKVTIENLSGKWDAGYTYIFYLKKGVYNSNEVVVLPSLAFFLGSLKDSLLDENFKPVGVLLDLYFDPENAEDVSLAQTLEGLRQFYAPLIDLAEMMTLANRDELLMIWTATIPEEIVISCFNSSTFPGCENANDAPLPSDFIMAYENDGSHHLDLPIDEDSPDMMKSLISALNTLDGWSTTKAFNITLSDDINADTLSTDFTNNPTLLVLKVADKDGFLAQPIPTGTIASFKDDWNQLSIKPIMKKWDESSTYLVILTNGVTGKNGEKLVKPITFSLMSEVESLLDEDGNSKYAGLSNEEAVQLEGARLQFSPTYDALEAIMGITRENISMMWTITTQTVTSEIKSMRDFVNVNPSFPDYMELDSTRTIPNSSFGAVFPGIDLSNVSVIAYGNFKAPIFLSELDSPYMGAFDPNKFPENATTPPLTNAEILKLPFIVAFPKPADQAVLPVASSKIIIFQHGFTRQKEDVIPLLNDFTAQGYIVISYDMPFHGERTVTNGASGDGFISLNVFASRDNIRESVLEQVKLIKTLKNISFSDIDTTNLVEYSSINPNEIYYVGHSMGTFVGNILFSVEDSVKAATLNAAGGNFTELLMTTTEDIKTPITDQLAALGVLEGTPEFEQFVYLAQTAVEKGESFNYRREDTSNLFIQEAVNDPVIMNYITRDLGVIEGFVNPLTNDILLDSNYKSYTTNANIESIHSFLLLNTDATQDAKDDIMNFFQNAQ